jgi:hypothetical protein
MDFVDEEANVTLSFRAGVPDTSIKDAGQWVLIGEGYNSENEALEAGKRYQDALMLALAKIHMGADFGSRVPTGFITNYGLQYFREQINQRALNNVHGLMVYESLPPAKFIEINMNPVLGRNKDTFEETFCSAIAQKPQLTDRERLALSLYHASFFQPTADTRFLLLVMAIEALIEPKPKSDKAIACVTVFIDQISSSSLPLDEKNSLIGSLRWLRDESISHAGKRLATETLGDKTYDGKKAAKFFSHVYSLRSNLVHGNMPYPTFNEISGVVATLENFVSDLLTISLPTPTGNTP